MKRIKVTLLLDVSKAPSSTPAQLASIIKDEIEHWPSLDVRVDAVTSRYTSMSAEDKPKCTS